MTQTEKTNLIHMALRDDGVVLAHFMRSEDAADFCRLNGVCHVPFNPLNREGAPVPAVGTIYKA